MQKCLMVAWEAEWLIIVSSVSSRYHRVGRAARAHRHCSLSGC